MNVNLAQESPFMPLLDHFRPPLSERRHWDSFQGAWAEAMATTLNESLLPERFVAEARVQLGGQVEIDVAAFYTRLLADTSPPTLRRWNARFVS